MKSAFYQRTLPLSGGISARTIRIRGVVQGVGFRPFVYRLALCHGLKGSVGNDSSGVIIHVEGEEEQLASFRRDISNTKPPLAHITEIIEQESRPGGFDEFSIIQSQTDGFHNTLISPDIATCEACVQELFDPTDRRFRYPFINCTNCGPRYTIVEDIPYDRAKTSMRHFEMCKECRAEYEDPGDRRFHAQPNACAACGPHVNLYEKNGRRRETGDPIKEAARLLKAGCILAVKGLGGFHLAADAENRGAVRMLRRRKFREEKPFAVMSPTLDQIRRFAYVGPEEEALLASQQRPVVLLKKRIPCPIVEEVSPRNRYHGVMLPYTPLHHLLTGEEFLALVMTSGNLSDEPIVIANDDAFLRLAGIADFFLVHNRDICLRCDDSVVSCIGGMTRMIRRSRGYAPAPILLKAKVPQILGCGAELKNTICLTKDRYAFVSQHIGDLKSLGTLDFFRHTISHMKRILGIEPEAIAFDMHPDYMSTRYAVEQTRTRQIQVQHHHAHIVSCMAENRLDGELIGLAFDGTGYGTDGRIWGGEVFIASLDSFERYAHMAWVPMPGGDAAVKEPWRMAVAYLWEVFGEDFLDLDLPALENISPIQLDLMCRMMTKGVNSPLTSSLGRLFDAVAAMTGIRGRADFEGQAAMELEMTSVDDYRLLFESGSYPFELPSGSSKEIPVDPIIVSVVKDIKGGLSKQEISTRFHWTLIRLFSELCSRARSLTGLSRVALSGGVFQNALFLKGLTRVLEDRGFDVYAHRLVPTNDGGICLGQAVAAAEIMKRQ